MRQNRVKKLTKKEVFMAKLKDMSSNINIDNQKTYNDNGVLDLIQLVDAEIAYQYQSRVSELREYVAILEQHQKKVSEEERPKLFAQMSYAYRRSVEACAWAGTLQTNAWRNVKKSEAVAAQEKFFEYVTKKKEESGQATKDTADNRKWYTQMDPDVVAASQKAAVIDGLCEIFYGLKMQFTQGISTLKAMYYTHSDLGRMNSAAVTHELPE